jgi:hypothetical protein
MGYCFDHGFGHHQEQLGIKKSSSLSERKAEKMIAILFIKPALHDCDGGEVHA